MGAGVFAPQHKTWQPVCSADFRGVAASEGRGRDRCFALSHRRRADRGGDLSRQAKELAGQVKTFLAEVHAA
jgi:hypothetical protein